MPFQCSICSEESTRICVWCTKDTCANHLCAKCARCSDCCECEVPLDEEVHAVAPPVREPEPNREPDPVQEPDVVPEPPPPVEEPTPPVVDPEPPFEDPLPTPEEPGAPVEEPVLVEGAATEPEPAV